MYGLMPIGDTPRRAGWWYHTDKATKMRWFFPPWGGPDTYEARAVTRKSKDDRIAGMAKAAFDGNVSLVEMFGTTKSSEQHVPIIDALVNDKEYHAQVNVRNDGALAGVPNDVAVEVPAIVNVNGIQPLRVEPLPRKVLLECILPDWLRMEQNLLAYQTRDRSVLLYEILENHQTRSYDQATAVLDELLSMDDNKELAAHFRWPKKW
jgi:alpha-galactosidase